MPEPGGTDPTTVRAAAAWLNLFGRTVKICRLYDAGNPTVVRFRGELFAAVEPLLRDSGAIELTFTSHEVRLGDAPVHTSESRDDNLALPFFRDGIRRLTLATGLEARELNALLDAVLHVTQREADLEDLVTLLWDAELPHVGIEYVSTEGDAESGAGESADPTAPIAPWPKPGGTSGAAPAAGAPEAGRSDDHETTDQFGDVEAAFRDLEARAPSETERFRRDFAGSEAAPAAERGLALLRDCIATASDPEERGEFCRFLPRILHESLADGAWSQARVALSLMRDAGGNAWSAAPLSEELSREGSVTTRQAIAQIDRQPPGAVEELAGFARELGPEGVEWLMQVIARSERQHVRRGLARVVASLAGGAPGRLAPWLEDPRWYVVRNAAHILAEIGGEATLGLLATAKDHPEPRVRREVAAALSQMPGAEARRLLAEILSAADGPLLSTILQRIGKRRDPEIAQVLSAMLRSDGAAARPEAETRALYLALAGVGDDSVLPDLEADVQNGSWLQPGDDARRFAAAMCVARIATPAARAVLERGAQSRRANVARACREALNASRPPSGRREAA